MRLGAAFATLLVLATGCDEREPGAPARPIERTAERGPVDLRVALDRDQIAAGDTVGLTVEVRAEPGVEVTMPTLADPFGDFEIRDERRPPDVPEDDRRVWRHRYVLQTFASGTLRLDPIEVAFVDRRDGAEPIEATVATDPIELTVRSLLADGDALDAPPLRDPVPVPVERARNWRWAILLGVLGLVVAAVVVAVLLLRRLAGAGTMPTAAPRIPAHEWALEQLRLLAERNLLETGAFHEYYVRLSDIVRQYIERRFALMAPERTTEEFLREAGRHPALTDEQRASLAGFLRSADMVKFALHVPQQNEGKAAMTAARRFIDETKPAAIATAA